MSEDQIGLVRYDATRFAIAEAHAVDEVKEIRNQAIALETYSRQAQNEEDERRCKEIRMRAERRAGQLLKETVRAVARGSNQYGSVARDDTSSRRIEDFGLTRDQSSKWQYVASLSDEEFEAGLEAGASTSDMVEMARIKERGGPVEAGDSSQQTRPN
jgi:hypothetical protein